MKKSFTLIELLVSMVIVFIIFIVFIMFSSAHASWFNSSPDTTSENTFTKEAAQTEINQRNLIQVQPIPQLSTSQERKNLIKRLNLFNTDNKVSYIYLVSFGKVMAFYTIKGKVSSVNSLLTNPNQMIDDSGNQCDRHNGHNCYIVPSPDIDGSYGTNGDAIFFFTTDNVYVEWRGDYMLVDQPLKLTTQPELIRTIK